MDLISTSPPEDLPLQPSLTGRSNGYAPADAHRATPLATTDTLDPNRRPSAIAFRAFLLGIALGGSITLTVLLLLLRNPPDPLWRAPFFLALLSVFHFLEFYITARCNPPAATLNAFLLTGNGYAYNLAHTLAFLECIFHNYTTSRYHPERIFLYPFAAFLPDEAGTRAAWMMLGLAMLLVGQGIRTLAMAQAGTNFNHLVQSKKKQGHVLVTDGIYGWLRHPSYFGFFWWGVGTQVVMGNVVCLAGYAVVLWRFFSHRIEGEFSPVPYILDRKPMHPDANLLAWWQRRRSFYWSSLDPTTYATEIARR
ncbi:MAG: hypothetical protein Q9200_002116 [Gallowayella weberi]